MRIYFAKTLVPHVFLLTSVHGWRKLGNKQQIPTPSEWPKQKEGDSSYKREHKLFPRIACAKNIKVGMERGSPTRLLVVVKVS